MGTAAVATDDNDPFQVFTHIVNITQFGGACS